MPLQGFWPLLFGELGKLVRETVADGGDALACLPSQVAMAPIVEAAPVERPDISPEGQNGPVAASSTADILPVAEAPESVLCNCWAYIRATYVPDLPPMAELIAGAGPTFAEIAVFRYPSGLHHFARVTGQGPGYFTVDEANYEPCARTDRRVSFSDPNLIGFYQSAK